tara:strand:+ start:14 stop:2542 length:2529 start_codon:yes stop_codon:yes gene_type:complete
MKHLLFLLCCFTFLINDGNALSNHSLIYEDIEHHLCVPETGTYVVMTDSQLEQLSNCTILDGNLFIHGGVDLNHTDLLPLSNLREITGYMVLWNSQNLHCLMGLHNLETIRGNHLYLDQYALYIKDNYENSHLNNHSELRNGLCYVNTVIWDTILCNCIEPIWEDVCIDSHANCHRPSIIPNNKSVCVNNTKLCTSGEYKDFLIKDNGENCPMCHEECDGCFSTGPRYCQNCVHYLSGKTCVNICPEGTIQNGIICIEDIPSEIRLQVSVLDKNNILCEWAEPIVPNGVILGYELYENDTNIFIENVEDDDVEHKKSHLRMNYTSTHLIPDTWYSYKIRARTSIGYGDFNEVIVVKTLGEIPPQPYPPVVSIIDANTVNISWTHLHNVTGTLLCYEFELYNDDDYYLSFNETGHNHSIIIDTLCHNSTYSVRLRGYTDAGAGDFSYFTYFRTPLGLPSVPYNVTGYALSSTSIHISWNVSETNIITNYSYKVYQNNTLILHDYSFPDKEVNITNLKPYTYYEFQVNAFSRNGEGIYTERIIVRTDIGYPPVPKTPELRIHETTLQLLLYKVSDINGPIIKYEIYSQNDEIVYSINYIVNNSQWINIHNVNMNIHNLNMNENGEYRYYVIVYTSDEYYSISNYSNTIIITPTVEPSTETPSTETPSTETPSTRHSTNSITTQSHVTSDTTISPPTTRFIEHKESRSEEDISNNILWIIFYVLLCFGIIAVIYVMYVVLKMRKKRLANIKNIVVTYTNPLFGDDNNNQSIPGTNKESHLHDNNINQNTDNYSNLENDGNSEYIEIEHINSKPKQITDSTYDKLNRIGMIPKNMLIEDNKDNNSI